MPFLQVAFQVLSRTLFSSLIPLLITLLDCQPWCQHYQGITFGLRLSSLGSFCSVDLSVCPHLCLASEVCQLKSQNRKLLRNSGTGPALQLTSLTFSVCLSWTLRLDATPSSASNSVLSSDLLVFWLWWHTNKHTNHKCDILILITVFVASPPFHAVYQQRKHKRILSVCVCVCAIMCEWCHRDQLEEEEKKSTFALLFIPWINEGSCSSYLTLCNHPNTHHTKKQ